MTLGIVIRIIFDVISKAKFLVMGLYIVIDVLYPGVGRDALNTFTYCYE